MKNIMVINEKIPTYENINEKASILSKTPTPYKETLLYLKY